MRIGCPGPRWLPTLRSDLAYLAALLLNAVEDVGSPVAGPHQGEQPVSVVLDLPLLAGCPFSLTHLCDS